MRSRVIPDEQEAIDAALNMGQPGDLLLIFADALVRSWKQITKFKPRALGTRRRIPAERRGPRVRRGARRGNGRSHGEAGDGAGQAGQPPRRRCPPSASRA